MKNKKVVIKSDANQSKAPIKRSAVAAKYDAEHRKWFRESIEKIRETDIELANEIESIDYGVAMHIFYDGMMAYRNHLTVVKKMRRCGILAALFGNSTKVAKFYMSKAAQAAGMSKEEAKEYADKLYEKTKDSNKTLTELLNDNLLRY